MVMPCPESARQFLVSRRTFLSMCAIPLVSAGTAGADAGTPAPGYEREEFDYAGVRLELWSKGSGPLVFILHEMNGLTRNCLVLGDDIAAQGFSVTIPRFFSAKGGAFLGYFKACLLRPAFSCYADFDYGKITPWIKALALYKSGNGNFGAIGNCMTGVLPLLMMRSQRCVAPVLCQPAYPLRDALFDDHGSSLGLSEIDLEFAQSRSERDGVPVLAIRYERDGLCPPQRFAELRRRFEPNFHCLQLAGKGHSTLITHRCAPAFDLTMAFLRNRLMNETWQPPPSSCSTATCGTHGG
jgi:dienelactone hydrolase